MKSQRGKTPKKNYVFSGVTVTEPVEVFCRIKPAADPENVCLKILSDNQVQLIQPIEGARNVQQKEYIYTFQEVFDESSSQKKVFDIVALPLVEDVVSGRNGLLFTYGVTGSGKTYTMTGNPRDQGLLPRCLDVVFNTIGKHQAKKYVFQADNQNAFTVQSEADAMAKLQDDIMPCPSTVPKTPKRDKSEFVESHRLRDTTIAGGLNQQCLYAIFVSYVEVYNNAVYDLLEELALDPITGHKAPQSKNIREDPYKRMYVHNCTEVEVKSPDEAFNVIYKGQSRRKVARTTLNESSSRSHSVFNIRVVQSPLDSRGEEVIQVGIEGMNADAICISQLSLVDLAGSERTVRTKNAGDRLKEASNINNSLMTLRNCIDILRENQKTGSNKMVPYRESKLTHLFKTYLEGDGKIKMIVCANPAANEIGETLHVMKFAEITREVMVQRTDGHLMFPPEPPNGKLYPVLDKDSDSGTSSDKNSQSSFPSIAKSIPVFDMGPPFPNMELVHPSDDSVLRELDRYLGTLQNKRQMYIKESKQNCEEFRSRLLLIEKDNSHLPVLEKEVFRLRKDNSNLKQNNSNLKQDNSNLKQDNQKLGNEKYELQQALREATAKLRSAEHQLQDKNMKIKLAKTEKSQMKTDYETRIQQNKDKFERHAEYEKQKMERLCRARIEEENRKMNMLRNIVNTQQSADSSESSGSTLSVTPRHTMKLRTFTTPAPHTGPRPDPAPRKPVTRLATANSLHNLNEFGTPYKNPAPPPNPRHRRSKSTSNAEVWLEHKSRDHEEIDTLLQPKLKKKRSVTKLTEKDTKEVSKYCLNHQEFGSDGEMRTKLFKGTVIPTVTGGCSMVFNDVEMVKRAAPGNGRKRYNDNQPPPVNNGQWTDTDIRCGYAIDGYKKNKPSAV